MASLSRTVRGRDAELVMLGVALGRVQAGVGAVVLVEGGPGMGKSRLLGEAARVAGRLVGRGNDRNIEITAKDLEVHPNTVRQRLDRFEEATGRSLRETETIAEVWWALNRRRLGSQAAFSPVVRPRIVRVFYGCFVECGRHSQF